MKITKKEALAKIEELKKFIEEPEKKEEKVIGIAIKNSWNGDIIFQSTKTTYKEAIEQKGDAYLNDADLSNVNLRNANLRNVNLRDADLRNVNLRDADLNNADLRGANLNKADLRNVNLCDADLNNADLRGANLRGAEMQNVKFYGKGGNKELKKSQIKDFLLALGFVIEK
jgi:hypothetical protein